MIRLFFITVQAFLCAHSLWSRDAETASFLKRFRERSVPSTEEIRLLSKLSNLRGFLGKDELKNRSVSRIREDFDGDFNAKITQGTQLRKQSIQKRKINRTPQHVAEATPIEAELPALPLPENIRPACKREKVGVCLKRRCPPLSPRSQKEEEGKLREFFGDDWTQIRDLIRSFWEVLLYAVDTGDTRALVKFFRYPLDFGFTHPEDQNLWEGWLLRDEKELRKVLRIMIRKNIKKWFFYNNNCKACILSTYGGSFYFICGEIHFRIKRLPLGKHGRYTYIIVLDSFSFDSDDFFNDIGRIRYELQRKGRRDNTGPYPQP